MAGRLLTRSGPARQHEIRPLDQTENPVEPTSTTNLLPAAAPTGRHINTDQLLEQEESRPGVLDAAGDFSMKRLEHW